MVTAQLGDRCCLAGSGGAGDDQPAAGADLVPVQQYQRPGPGPRPGTGRRGPPLTELPDVAAAQEAQPSPRPIVGVSGTSRSPGHGSHVASLIATETGHTVLNHLPSFSSLPIFDVSRGGALSTRAA